MKTFKELYEACCSACEKRDEMEESDSGLAAKADKSGVSIGTLRKVYKRGVAAWNSGHRPGTTPQQWGMARVNSYITKGKGTYHGADKDLREEEVEIDEDDLSVRTLYNKYADRTANAKNTKPVEKAIKKVHGSKVLSHMKKAASANIDTKFDKEKQHFDKARKAAGNTDMIGATVGKNRSAFRKQYEEVELEEVAKDKESGLPKKYVSGLSSSTAKARAAHWEKMDKLSDKDPAAYEPAPGDATAKTKESKHTKKAREMFGEACWTGYKRVGMKKKGDKMVPNCVPANEETDRNQRLRDALAKIKNDFSNPPAGHKEAEPSKPTPATKPKTGGGMPYYPDSRGGRRYMGDSVEMDGEQIDELSKGTLRKYGDASHEQESDIRYTLKRTEKSKHISAGAKDELRKLADRRKAGIKLAADKRGYYKGTSGNYKFTHGDAKVHATEETQKGKNVVPPTAGTIGSIGGLVREEENENKPLGKVMRAGDGKKKFKVFVKNSKGNVVKVGFGDPNMEIKRDDPERRKNFRARHNCDAATDRTTPRYWSCRQWRSSAKVEA